jgi:hypothetical protein
MAEVHQRLKRRKGGDPSLVIRRLDAFIDAADALLNAWDPVLEGGGYPRCLPSFDEFIDHLREWRESASELDGVKRSGVEPVDLAKPEELRRWLLKLDANICDAIAAGDDATRPPGQRDLGRMMARQRILESRHSLRVLVEAARRSLPAMPDAEDRM